MDLVVVGAGRAGGSIALAADEAGHTVVGVLSRARDSGESLAWDEPLPPCDLLILAVSDSAIEAVAERLAPWAGAIPAAVHLSGFVSVSALAALAERDVATGSFHPLQTLPDPVRGAQALAGSWAAVTAGPDLAERLTALGESMGMRAFSLADEAKPLYHAAASAAANYVAEALALSADLARAAGVPFEAMEPLTRSVVDNVFRLGPDASLTGPIERGDTATVRGQLAAVEQESEALAAQFRSMAEATAARVGRQL
jgi:predicted short-subunit dehydrogenase-like oxidoreductase (DUF2520 family)